MQDIRNFIFLENADYYCKITHPKFIQTYHFKTDLGFMKFIDSTWLKHTDSWKVTILFDENDSKTVTHAYALNINSQFLNTYRYFVNKMNETESQWRGGFFNPATISFSYNVSVSLWKYSSIMLGLSSLRVVWKPIYEGVREPKETPFRKTKNSFILAHYGMSGQVNIYSKKITENITWDNTSSFFVNGISKDQVSFDFQNRITFKLVRYVQLRFDTHIIYDPLTSYNLQYDQEFLVGVFYEKKNK